MIIGVFFLQSIMLVFLGIMGEYVGAIYTQLQHRPYAVELERINFDTPFGKAKATPPISHCPAYRPSPFCSFPEGNLNLHSAICYYVRLHHLLRGSPCNPYPPPAPTVHRTMTRVLHDDSIHDRRPSKPLASPPTR